MHNNQSQNFGLVEVRHANIDIASGKAVNEVQISISSRGSMSLTEAREHLADLQAAINHAKIIELHTKQ